MLFDKFDAIVISGGGLKGLCSLGAIQYEYEKSTYDYKHVQIFAGTSIGAILSLLLICGYSPIEAFIEISKIDDFFDIQNDNIKVDLWDFLKLMGLMSINGLMKKVEDIVKNKLGYIPTLNQLKEDTGKTLVVAVTNVTKMRSEYYTYKTKPNLSCIDAVKFSCNLPFIFQRLRYNDSYMVDGGVIDNFPVSYIDNGKLKILGIVSNESNSVKTKLNFYDYFYRLFILPIVSNTKLRCEMTGANTKLIKVDTKDVSLLPLSVSYEEKMNIFTNGFEQAKLFDQTIYINCKDWNDDIHEI